jgi:hypothetical protein
MWKNADRKMLETVLPQFYGRTFVRPLYPFADRLGALPLHRQRVRQRVRDCSREKRLSEIALVHGALLELPICPSTVFVPYSAVTRQCRVEPFIGAEVVDLQVDGGGPKFFTAFAVWLVAGGLSRRANRAA